MSVDRYGVAWVLYSNGKIFHVSTRDASCVATFFFSPRQFGFRKFGMGFVTQGENSIEESLFIAEAFDDANMKRSQFGQIDKTTLKIKKIGILPSGEYNPELTGTSDGKLYGYFPGLHKSSIVELEKTTGESLLTWPLEPSGEAVAWDFAHWGGKFYIFVTANEIDGESSKVIEFDPSTNEQRVVVKDGPYRVVGAGVSTCAPVDIE